METLADLLLASRSWRSRLGGIAPPPLLAQRASPLGAIEALFNIERRVAEGSLAPVRVALFGPTNPAVWAPRGPNVRILHADSRRAPLPGGCHTGRCLLERFSGESQDYKQTKIDPGFLAVVEDFFRLSSCYPFANLF